MMIDARFTENETGLEVLVSCPLPWGDTPKQALIKMPDGSVYSIPDSELGKHFTCVSPQDIQIKAFGGTPFMRPTPKQKAIDDADKPEPPLCPPLEFAGFGGDQ